MFLKLKQLHDLQLNVGNVLKYDAYIAHYNLIAKNHLILVIIFPIIFSNAISFQFSFFELYFSYFLCHPFSSFTILLLRFFSICTATNASFEIIAELLPEDRYCISLLPAFRSRTSPVYFSLLSITSIVLLHHFLSL